MIRFLHGIRWQYAMSMPVACWTCSNRKINFHFVFQKMMLQIVCQAQGNLYRSCGNVVTSIYLRTLKHLHFPWFQELRHATKKKNNQTCTRCWSWDNLIYLRTAKRQRFSCYRNLLCATKIKINRTSTAPGDVKLQFGLGPGYNCNSNGFETCMAAPGRPIVLSNWATEWLFESKIQPEASMISWINHQAHNLTNEWAGEPIAERARRRATEWRSR